jgi:predicted  nucleic acid-binding Zn-ribbon protein
MSDEELVKRLRSWAKDIQAGSTAIYAMDLDLKNAATSIEALTAERDEALNQLDSARHSVDVLEKRVAFVEGERRKSFQGLLKVTKIHDEVEAKLSKAVEALRDLTNAFAKKVDVDQTRWKTPYEHPLSAYDRAVAFLKGENP